MPKRARRRRVTLRRKVNGNGAPMPSPPRTATVREIIAATRQLSRLENSRRGLNRKLRQIEEQIRNRKRELHALTTEIELPLDGDQTPPLRVFGEVQGE